MSGVIVVVSIMVLVGYLATLVFKHLQNKRGEKK